MENMDKRMLQDDVNEGMYRFDMQCDMVSGHVQVRRALRRKEREEMALSLASTL